MLDNVAEPGGLRVSTEMKGEQVSPQVNGQDHSWDIRSEDMPADMRVLLTEYPRDSWQSHPGFRDKTVQWLSAHQWFRRIATSLRKDTEQYLDGNKEEQDYISRLSYRGGQLVNNLHGHHGWEDHSYFPELSAADSRFDAGLDILEKDHFVLNQVLEEFTAAANRFIRLSQLDSVKARSEADSVHTASQAIEQLLHRHLGDEEELAVPIILHHRLRG